MTRPHLQIQCKGTRLQNHVAATLIWLLFESAAWLVAGVRPTLAQVSVDLELVLAVDASGSIDEQEFRLQMSGIADAFRDPEVVAAVASGPLGRIGVAVAVWADAHRPKDSTPWFVLHDTESAGRFADTVERFPRRVVGATGLGAALLYCMRLLEGNSLQGSRQVIDVSGDGRETTFREWTVFPHQARRRAEMFGVTINGLAILSDEPDLDRYYRLEIATGFGSFVEKAATFADFRQAIRKKLLREIEHQPIVGWR